MSPSYTDAKGWLKEKEKGSPLEARIRWFSPNWLPAMPPRANSGEKGG